MATRSQTSEIRLANKHHIVQSSSRLRALVLRNERFMKTQSQSVDNKIHAIVETMLTNAQKTTSAVRQAQIVQETANETKEIEAEREDILRVHADVSGDLQKAEHILDEAVNNANALMDTAEQKKGMGNENEDEEDNEESNLIVCSMVRPGNFVVFTSTVSSRELEEEEIENGNVYTTATRPGCIVDAMEFQYVARTYPDNGLPCVLVSVAP